MSTEVNAPDVQKVDLETAELLSRRSVVTNREVEFRRKLGIVFGDQVILALIIDMYYDIIPGKNGYFWKLAEPIIKEFEDIILKMNPNNYTVWSEKEELDTAGMLAQQAQEIREIPIG